MTTFGDDSVTWEFDAPRYFDFEHPEEASTRWNDSWFKESSSDSSQTRNNRRLRAIRRPLPTPSRPLPAPVRPLPAPSRPLPALASPFRSQITTPVPAGRDIFAALASTQQQQQQQTLTHSHVRNPEEKTTSLARFAQPTAASLSKARTTGTRDVATEIKRITNRFAKKPQDKASTSSSVISERPISKKGKEVDRGNWNDNNKENVPPHERENIVPHHDIRKATHAQPQPLSPLFDHGERLVRKEPSAETADEDRVSHQEVVVDKEQPSEKVTVSALSADEDLSAYHEAVSMVDQIEEIEEELHPQERTPPPTMDQESHSQHEEVNKVELDQALLRRSLAEELASQKEPLSAATKDNELSTPATGVVPSPSHQSKVSQQQEQSLTNTTIRVGRERMREWLDDQTADPSAVEPSTPIEESHTQLVRSPEKPRSEPVKVQSIRMRPNNNEAHDTVVTPTNFDALFDRMNVIRSQLLHVAKGSAVKPAESTMVRNQHQWETPIREEIILNRSLSDHGIIEQRIARARRVIEESKRHSQTWFVKDFSAPVPPILAPAINKRKSLAVDDARPKKMMKSLSALSSELHNNLSRRGSMDNGLSAMERVERLKQAASRRASRVSSTRSVYLPIAPTVPKSPAFATDVRSRLSSREYYR